MPNSNQPIIDVVKTLQGDPMVGQGVTQDNTSAPGEGRPSRPGKETRMSIGAGIALFAIGAILAFAVNVDVEYVNLDMIGYILMIAGAVIFIIGIVLMARRRSTDTVTRTAVDPAAGEQVTRSTTSRTDDGVGL